MKNNPRTVWQKGGSPHTDGVTLFLPKGVNTTDRVHELSHLEMGHKPGKMTIGQMIQNEVGAIESANERMGRTPNWRSFFPIIAELIQRYQQEPIGVFRTVRNLLIERYPELNYTQMKKATEALAARDWNKWDALMKIRNPRRPRTQKDIETQKKYNKAHPVPKEIEALAQYISRFSPEPPPSDEEVGAWGSGPKKNDPRFDNWQPAKDRLITVRQIIYMLKQMANSDMADIPLRQWLLYRGFPTDLNKLTETQYKAIMHTLGRRSNPQDYFTPQTLQHLLQAATEQGETVIGYEGKTWEIYPLKFKSYADALWMAKSFYMGAQEQPKYSHMYLKDFVDIWKVTHDDWGFYYVWVNEREAGLKPGREPLPPGVTNPRRNPATPQELVNRLADKAMALSGGDLEGTVKWLVSIGAKDVMWEEDTDGRKVSASLTGPAGIRVGIIPTDPVNSAVILGMAIANMYWPWVYPGLLKEINKRWHEQGGSGFSKAGKKK